VLAVRNAVGSFHESDLPQLLVVMYQRQRRTVVEPLSGEPLVEKIRRQPSLSCRMGASSFGCVRIQGAQVQEVSKKGGN
jgi:hypothetical protein